MADEPRSGGSPRLAALLAWLIPGAGHFYLGRRRRAVAFLVLTLASLGVGCALHGNLYRMEAGSPLSIPATLASMGAGLPYFLLRMVAGYRGDLTAVGYEYGTAFLLTAGLMNLLLVLDAWDIANGRKD